MTSTPAIPSGSRFIPAWVELAGDRLIYSDDSPQTVLRGTDDAAMLDDFRRLADAPDPRICDYARRYGVLWLCEHNVPATHSLPTVSVGQTRGCRPRRQATRAAYWEPLSVWRDYSKQASDLIAAIQSHRDLSPKGGWIPDPVVDTLNSWLAMAGVRPVVDWIDGRLRLRWGGVGMFSDLALQLVLRAAQAEGLGLCSGCSKPYIPPRRPRAGERHYCPDCGLRQARRDAAREYRSRVAAKRALARTLRQSGESLRTISQRLGVRMGVVRQWVDGVGSG